MDAEKRNEIIRKVEDEIKSRQKKHFEAVGHICMSNWREQAENLTIDLAEAATASEIFKAIEGQGPWHTDSDGWKQLKKKFGVE
jgi:hypothetical protein